MTRYTRQARDMNREHDRANAAAFAQVPEGWHTVERSGELILLHNTRPLWIVFYPSFDDGRGGAFFQAYRIANWMQRSLPPSGRNPWTVDNRAIGPRDRGFKTLDEAVAAAIAWRFTT